jgi:purine-binding chemotaxis protein CheW
MTSPLPATPEPHHELPPRTEAVRERVRRILRERAQALARKVDTGVVEETTDLVTLDLAGRRYAVETAIVREVFAVREVTPLPTAPDSVLGITNVRGKIVAVLDLRAVLGHARVRHASGQIIIVAVSGVEVGIDVEECGIARVPRSRVRPTTGAASGYLKAIAVDDRGVLDLERIISDTRQTAAPLTDEAAP